jgi:hypothetical protein
MTNSPMRCSWALLHPRDGNKRENHQQINV